jgi:hypothetical protein
MVHPPDAMPGVLVSDRDPKFVGGFWDTLWRRLGTRLRGDGRPNGARQHIVSPIITLFLLLRRVELNNDAASSGIHVQRYPYTRN